MRENIYEVIEATGEKIRTLVIPTNKGLKGYAWKVLKEAGLDLDKDEKAKYFRPALCLIGLSRNPGNIPIEARIALNGKYEFTGRLYLSKNPQLKGRRFYATVYSGGLEYRVASGANDYCIDTVYRGDTIGENGLIEVGDPIRFSDLVVISPLSKDKPGLLEVMAKYIQKGSVIVT